MTMYPDDLGPDEQAILHQRAAALARPQRLDADLAPAQAEWLGLDLGGGDHCLVSLSEVEAVLSLTASGAATITAVPGVPTYVLGLMAGYGGFLTVLDGRALLALPPLPPSPETEAGFVLIVPLTSGRVAVRVAQVDALLAATEPERPAVDAPDHLLGWVPGQGPLITLRRLVEQPRWRVDMA